MSLFLNVNVNLIEIDLIDQSIWFLGILDSGTLELMNTPRCGNRDKVGHSEDAKRRKRYALQG